VSTVLLIDFGSTYTKLTAVNLASETIQGTARAVTTVETDIMEGLNRALEQLFETTGKLEFEKVLACSSAAGGLKMIAIGLVEELTAEAAKRATLGAGAKLLGVYSHELSEYEIAEMEGLHPDIILLAGGIDGGNKEVILHNAHKLNTLKKDVPIVVAGNKSVTPEVVNILKQTKSEVCFTENVMPEINTLNIEPAYTVIRDIFLRKIIQAKGIDKAMQFVDRVVMPTPAAVLEAAELLSSGTEREKGLGELMAVDIGGSTTDIYSIASGRQTKSNVLLRGLPEPQAKRTVEGDLGMRYSATALLKACGAKGIAEYAHTGEEQVREYVRSIETRVDYLPKTPEEESMEVALARACAAIGTERHVGSVIREWTLTGTVLVQTGKDLTGIKTVVGTGGVIVDSRRPEAILSGVVYSKNRPNLLKPIKPEYLVDDLYIMAGMGLLAEEYPDIALRMMKRYIRRREACGTEK